MAQYKFFRDGTPVTDGEYDFTIGTASIGTSNPAVVTLNDFGPALSGSTGLNRTMLNARYSTVEIATAAAKNSRQVY